MKAVIIRKFGAPDVMNIEEVAAPVLSRDAVLIRVHYTSVNPVDWKIRSGFLRFITGARFPMALGFDVAGEVIETGSSVIRFKQGDRVFGMLDYRHRGAYAEYASAREDTIALIPEGLGLREAAAIPLAGLTAYQALHYKGRMKSGHRILINGASGGVGTFAVQIAKAAGASVTAVCGTESMDMVKKLGADAVMDYRKQDISQAEGNYDILFDAVGTLTFSRIKNRLKGSGRYITTLPDNPSNIISFLLTPFFSVFGCPRSTFISVKPKSVDLERLCDLVHDKRVVPVIDREFSMGEIREAHEYSETGHAKGKIVIKVR